MNEDTKYYRREKGGIVKLEDKVSLYSLTAEGEWVPNQYAISMFYDGNVEYEEISATEVDAIIEEAKKKVGSGGLRRWYILN